MAFAVVQTDYTVADYSFELTRHMRHVANYDLSTNFARMQAFNSMDSSPVLRMKSIARWQCTSA